jgi:hypothetical protein
VKDNNGFNRRLYSSMAHESKGVIKHAMLHIQEKDAVLPCDFTLKLSI